ncbi:MAG: MFS transporter [Acidilobaceae archaeon]
MLALRSSDFSKLLVLNFIVSMLMGVTYSVYAPYLKLHGITALQYGTLSSALLFSALLSTIISGWLCDKFGSRLILMLSFILVSSSLALLASSNISLIYLSYIIAGLSQGSGSVSGLVLATRLRGLDEYDRILPYLSSSSTIGSGLGLFGGWIPVIISSTYDIEIINTYRLILIVVALIVPLVSIPLIASIREDFRGKPESSGILGRNNIPWNILARLIAINIVISLGAGMSIHLIDYYFVLKFNVSSGELGTVLGAVNFIMGILMLLTPKLSRIIGGALRTYIIIASPSIILLILMTLTSSYTISSIIYIARTILMNVANPLYQAFEVSLIPKEYRGRGVSLISIAWQIPAGIGRGIGGALMSYNIEAPLIATSILYTLAFTMLIILFPDHILRVKSMRIM